MQLSQLLPSIDDRATLLGQTGTGKTTLAQHLLEHRDYAVVFDTKGRINWPGWKLYTDFKKLTDHAETERHLIYRPAWRDVRDEGHVDRFFGWIRLRKRTTVYSDELRDFTRGLVAPPNYEWCVTRGREDGISVIGGTQRPSLIPSIALSESESYFVFFLKLRQDRIKAEELTGIPEERIATLPKHWFMEARQDQPKPRGPFTLTFGSPRSSTPARPMTTARIA